MFLSLTRLDVGRVRAEHRFLTSCSHFLKSLFSKGALIPTTSCIALAVCLGTSLSVLPVNKQII